MKRAFVLILFLFVACKAKEHYSLARTSDAPSMERGAAAPPPPARAAVTSTGAPLAPLPNPAPRMIIRNATVSLVVRDAVDVLRRISAAVEGKGGYVAENRQWKEREQVRATAILRVPAAELNATLAALRSLAVRVESETVTSQDITQEYVDLGAQLKNLQATETELRELLRTVRLRTEKASEVIEVFNEITKVRGEIERIQGRLQYLSQMSALSTITVDLIPDVLAAPVVEPGWQPVATIKSASRALVNSMKTVADALIWLVLYILPLGLIFVVVALIVRATWRRLRTSPSPPQSP